MSEKKFDPYEHVTNRIIEYFESSDDVEWQAPWQGLNVPHNAHSGRGYNGVNVLLLWIRMQEEGWENALFLTFKQLKQVADKFPEQQCNIRKGSKSESVCFWKRIESNDKETGEKKIIPLLRLYRVFNIDQVEASDEVRKELMKHAGAFEFEDERERDEELEAFLAHLGSKVLHRGNKAAYFPKSDKIHMPKIDKFKSSESYYSIRFHEEAHRTGHESRLNRKLENRFGSDAYAFEELVAEMSSAFLCARFGFNSTLQHPEYVKHWTKRMGEDKYAIFKSSSLAKDVLDWMDEQQLEHENVA